MKKFDLKKIPVAKVVGVLSIIAAGAGAVFTEIDNQSKEKLIKDLTDRVTNLENK